MPAGKDPEALWTREWDGKWRLVLFDMPGRPAAPRAALRKTLVENGFGCLQGSVWVSPVPLDTLGKAVRRGDRHPGSLTLFEGTTVGDETPAEIVCTAWDFEAIGERWGQLNAAVEEGRGFPAKAGFDPKAFRDWSAREHAAWREVLEAEPFLPGALLPKGYEGRTVWKARAALWRDLAQWLGEQGFGGTPEAASAANSTRIS